MAHPFIFVDFDLLHTGIALDINNAFARKQVLVELVRAANVQDRVSLTVELDDFVLRQSSAWRVGQIPRAKTPAPLEAELRSQFRESLRGVGMVSLSQCR